MIDLIVSVDRNNTRWSITMNNVLSVLERLICMLEFLYLSSGSKIYWCTFLDYSLINLLQWLHLSVLITATCHQILLFLADTHPLTIRNIELLPLICNIGCTACMLLLSLVSHNVSKFTAVHVKRRHVILQHLRARWFKRRWFVGTRGISTRSQTSTNPLLYTRSAVLKWIMLLLLLVIGAWFKHERRGRVAHHYGVRISHLSTTTHSLVLSQISTQIC